MMKINLRMMKSLFICVLVISCCAWENFQQYTQMCVGVQGKCYNMWYDSNTSYAVGAIDYTRVEKWTYVFAYNQLLNQSIGWAQSHAQAMTYSYWMYQWLHNTPRGIIRDWSLIQERSIVLAAPPAVTNCTSPAVYGNYTVTQYLQTQPFMTNSNIPTVYTDSAFALDIYNISSWCDYKALAAIDTSKMLKYRFSGYESLNTTVWTYPQWVLTFRSFGIGVIPVPHDFHLAGGMGYYSDGVLRVNTSAILYYYPGNVVGVWMPGNGSVFYLTYVFGASCQWTNYLWVKSTLSPLRNFVIWFIPIAYGAI